jgi:hypothetical protein
LNRKEKDLSAILFLRWKGRPTKLKKDSVSFAKTAGSQLR